MCEMVKMVVRVAVMVKVLVVAIVVVGVLERWIDFQIDSNASGQMD